MIDPARILTSHAAGIFAVTPFQGLAARTADGHGAPGPIDFAGDGLLQCAADIETQQVAARFRGHLPPETDRAGSGDGGLERGGAAVGDASAARGVHAIMIDGGLPDPRRRADGGPRQVGGIHGQTERHEQIHLKQGVCAGGRADGVADDHRIMARLLRLHIGHGERGRRGCQEIGSVEAPLIGERRRAARCDGEGRVASLIHELTGGIGGDRHRTRHKPELIDPAAILAGGRAGILRVGPEQRLRTRADGEGSLLPVHFAGDGALGGAVHVEGQKVLGRLRRNLPPERHRARTRDDGLERTALAVRDGTAAGRVLAIVGGDQLPRPRQIAARRPSKVVRIDRVGHGHERRDRQQGAGTGLVAV